VADVVASAEHTCVLLRDDNGRCWGRNSEGQLGYGRNDDIGDNETPLVTNLNFNGATVRQLAAGAHHTCALLTNGAVRCWGFNAYGQLGQGDMVLRSTPTAAVVRLGTSVVRLASGANHNCALLTTSRVRCWGLGSSGQLGYGTTDSIGDNEQADAAGPIALLGP